MRGGSGLPMVVEEVLTPGERRKVIKRTWRMLRPYRRDVVLAGILVLVQAGSMLAGPAIVRYGIDTGIRGRDTGAITAATVLFALTSVVAYVSGRAVITLVARAGESLLRDLRERVFNHLLSLSLDFFDRSRTGALIARMTADIESLQELVAQGLTMFIVNALLFVGAMVAMTLLSWQLALATLLVVPMMLKGVSWFRRESNRSYLQLRERIGATLSTLQEGISGVRVVQAFNQQPALIDRFTTSNEELFDANVETQRIAALFFPIVELAQGLAVAIILGAGGLLTARGAVTVGTVAAFVLYLQNLFEPIQQLSQLFNTMQAAGASLTKVFGLLDEPATIAERPGALDLPATGDLEVDGVSFGYQGAAGRALEGVSLVHPAGRRLALVGPTGAGKSTLAKLLVRLYDPTEGAVRFGGIDLRDASLRSLRHRIVVVPQEGFLFSGTIRDNLLIGRPGAADADVLAAIDRLGLSDRFAAFPGGLDTPVREQGANFSAGERQLVSLVRAALADPAVVVLDEATANLDPGTELIVERALEVLMTGRTVVVVAHRLTTAARADAIAVIADGHLIQMGSHDELLAAGGAYAALFASWSAGLSTG